LYHLTDMRDQLLVLPFGSQPVRKFFVTFAAIFMVFFASILLFSNNTYAQTTTETASWQGETLSFEGKRFTAIKDAASGDSHKLPVGSKIFASVQAGGLGGGASKAYLIYFAPGSDPGKSTSATYITYDYASGTDTYSNPTASQSITVEPKSTATAGATSCAIEGIGWMVCWPARFIASGMDTLYGILASFLEVRPVQTTQDNALFRAWSYMRNFANICFVIGFLIVIYSQVSNVGVSNYGIKKMLPRLIIAAILVNISYWVCAVAVDASNIAGYSIQQIFESMRGSLVGPEGNNWDTLSWESITGFVLSGGSALTGGIIAAYAISAASVTGSVYMLLPILVGVLIAVLIALLVMALRQALITILIIVAPLAFVAYLLPNTEKYFEKWRELFTTMLVMFPIFSVIFGGSQLAGMAIIQNANSINLIILGMAVMVAPVIITPLLVKFSGALLSRFTGMVNNPSKGLIDRTRNWAKEQRDEQKAEVLGQDAPAGIRGWSRRRTQNIERRRKRGKAWMETNNAHAEARWMNDPEYRRIHQASAAAHMLKETGEARAEAHVNHLKTQPGILQTREVDLRVAKLDVDVSKARADVQWENMRAATSALNATPAGLDTQARQARELTLAAAVIGRQLHSAQHEQQQDFANALKGDRTGALLQQAGGISENGANSALAAAIATTRKAYGESVAEARQIVKHFNLSSEQRQEHALGNDVTVTDSAGNTRTFRAGDTYTREAVIEDQIKTGTVKEAQQLVGLSGSSLAEFRTTISEAVAEAGLGGKTIYLGGSTINEIAKGTIASPADLTGVIQNNIARGKTSADKLATADKDALASILQAARQTDTSHMDPSLVADYAAMVQALKAQATKALTDEILSPKLAANQRAILEDIERLP
jgi:hypothetical protein